jgi:hypothetical protein
MTSSGTEPATFRFVPQCLNQLRHRVPQFLYVGMNVNPEDGNSVTSQIFLSAYKATRRHITHHCKPYTLRITGYNFTCCFSTNVKVFPHHSGRNYNANRRLARTLASTMGTGPREKEFCVPAHRDRRLKVKLVSECKKAQ